MTRAASGLTVVENAGVFRLAGVPAIASSPYGTLLRWAGYHEFFAAKADARRNRSAGSSAEPANRSRSPSSKDCNPLVRRRCCPASSGRYRCGTLPTAKKTGK